MNNYNNITFTEEPFKRDSKYFIYNNNNQTEWINKVAKKAARQISEQLRSSNSSKEIKK